MSFRKRNSVMKAPASLMGAHNDQVAPGTRPSPVDARPTTSTGTATLDQLLAGHAGLPLGTLLLIDEAGTTDFGGTLLRYFAAEGLVQGHQVHALGVDSGWKRELPGLASETKAKLPTGNAASSDKMKIAWRYESLANSPKLARGM